jgi:AraC-like DNA-binding protein
LHSSLFHSIEIDELSERLQVFLEKLAPSVRSERVQGSRERLERARMALHETYNQNTSIDELSSLSCLSKFHFIREFTRMYGASPLMYRNAIRIAKARQLLFGSAEIKFIAYELGFSDQSHFGRVFREAVGFTPAFYRSCIKPTD